MNVGLNAQLAQGQFQNQALEAQLAESAANRQMQALGIARQNRFDPLQAALGYQQALSPFQQRADQQAQSQYQEFLRTAPENNPYYGVANAFLGQQGKYAYQGSSPVAGALGGALGGGALGMSALGYGTMVNPLLGLGALAGFFL